MPWVDWTVSHLSSPDDAIAVCVEDALWDACGEFGYGRLTVGHKDVVDSPSHMSSQSPDELVGDADRWGG